MHTYRASQDVSVLADYLEVPGLGFLPVNAFVIHAAQPVVVDTGLGLPDRDFVAALADVIDPADVAWIWLTHPDRDHTGGLFALLDAARTPGWSPPSSEPASCPPSARCPWTGSTCSTPASPSTPATGA
jgi:glyoxylase-like metal-dependent hydrolase (beta-lactamase superfamily II)